MLLKIRLNVDLLRLAIIITTADVNSKVWCKSFSSPKQCKHCSCTKFEVISRPDHLWKTTTTTLPPFTTTTLFGSTKSMTICLLTNRRFTNTKILHIKPDQFQCPQWCTIPPSPTTPYILMWINIYLYIILIGNL